MNPVTPRLAELVQRLDTLSPGAALADIARALEDVPLNADDVEAHIQPDRQSYHRSRVVLRKHYELLVMTWLPGQGSVPHDHTGSVCAVKVIRGRAVESSYSVAPDGYVDLEYEASVDEGEVSAGQDAGVHTLRNPAQTGEPLVTVHVYAPPLKDFRRFVPRPTGRRLRPHRPPTVVVVGGGFSGSMTAAQLLRGAERLGMSMRVALVERRGTVAEGLAYSTAEPVHLLNVPAGRMSAWPDRPSDFFDWAVRRHADVKPGDFLPRQWYGAYVRDALFESARSAATELSVILDEVRRVARHPAGGWMVHLDRGTSLRADAVVLAVGHRPPSDPLQRAWTGPRDRFIADPWRPLAVGEIGPDEPVVILGSGLTAIDTVLSLSQQKRTAPITLVSRRGLRPQAHAAAPSPPTNMGELVNRLLSTPKGLRALAATRLLRREIRTATAAGGDWRSVIDGVRPHTATIWNALSTHERRTFLTHLRPFWEVHRHRLAPTIANRLRSLLDNGDVAVVAGRVTSAVAGEKVVRLTVRDRGADTVKTFDAGWVVNCTGPVPSNCAESNPAIGSLLVHDCLKHDELSLGLETTGDGKAVDAAGRESPDLFVVGTLRKPASWESTAVPELRQQAADVSEHVLRWIGVESGSSASPPDNSAIQAM
jgi:uncharacterized NAD(P)/FAD-binding protein YdhS/predicted metal-dependent enzyme (double-stranded beta helix superfamily)